MPYAPPLSGILKKGSKGDEVTELQNLLNYRLKPSPGLVVDGKFGPATDAAVRRFQSSKWLVIDGCVGPCTWSALYEAEEYVVYHAIKLVPQPTTSTCWAASTAMLKGIPISTVLQHNQGLFGKNGLPNDSEFTDPLRMKHYAAHNNLGLILGQSWTARGFANLMKSKGPLMLNILWNPAGYVTPDPNDPSQYLGSSGHMVVAHGIRGDGTEIGSTLRISDPWPPGVGKAASFSYLSWMEQHLTGTYQILHRM